MGAQVAPRKWALGKRNMHFWHILGWKNIKNVFEFSGLSKYDFSFSQIPGWSVFLAAAVLLATQYKHKNSKNIGILQQNSNSTTQ